MSSGSLLPEVERVFGDGTVAGLPEGALLERFLVRRDELAFEALVTRHGPLVLGVCRRLLHDPGDIEDAFQATFLILVRKARSIQESERLGPWLYGVAYRVAMRSRVVRARRRGRERGLGELEPADAAPDVAWRELRPVLDEELARLPEKYRAPLVLCYLQGMSHNEAAERLRCPVGTVRSRLARGRERLGVRLVRRGLGPSVGLLGTSLAAQASGGALPAALARTTSLAALRFAAGEPAAKILSASSAALLEGVLGMMTWKTLGRMTAATLAVVVIAAGAFFAGRWSDDESEYAGMYELKVPQNVQRVSLRPLPAYTVQPSDLVVVEVLDALPGRPIMGEHLVRPDGTISLGFYGDIHVAGLTTDAIKEKIILHLRKFLTDEVLGLWKIGGKETEELKRLREKYIKELGYSPPSFTTDVDEDEPLPPPRVDQSGSPAGPHPTPSPPSVGPPQEDKSQPGPRAKKRDPYEGMVPLPAKESDTVYVDVAQYNSTGALVLGEVVSPGAVSVFGSETVLDAIIHAGGVQPWAAPDRIRLIRPGKGDAPDQVLPVDYVAIAHGVDPSTNYQVFPGDRIVVPADPRRLARAAQSRQWSSAPGESTVMQRRIDQLEKKLDEIARALRGNAQAGDSKPSARTKTAPIPGMSRQ